MKYSEDVAKLVVARLSAIPPNLSFSIGSHGDFTARELIQEVKKKTEVGQATVEMQLTYIRKMPQLSALLTSD